MHHLPQLILIDPIGHGPGKSRLDHPAGRTQQTLHRNCAAYRTPSMSSISPQHPHKVADGGRTPPIQSSQTGASPALSKGPPQALQSAGKKVVTRSSKTARATLPGLRKTRETARHSTTPSGGPPGGAPAVSPSALSFKHSLKTHLTRGTGKSRAIARSISPPHGLPSTILHQTRCIVLRPDSRCYTPSQPQATACGRGDIHIWHHPPAFSPLYQRPNPAPSSPPEPSSSEPSSVSSSVPSPSM